MVPAAPRKGRDLMSDWPTLYTVLFVIACGSAIAAAIALPFIWRKGSREIDAALATVLQFTNDEQARTNVRRLRAHEVHAAVQKAKRRHPSGGAS